MMRVIFLAMTITLVACGTRNNVQCAQNSNCDLSGGGVCLAAPTGNKWCAYPDPQCASGLRYSNVDVGDSLGGVCTEPQTGSTFKLTVSIGGSGSGTVTATPTALNCTAGICTGTYPSGSQVQITGAATSGSFLGFSGDCLGVAACTVTMDKDRTVGALFGMFGDALWVRQLGGPSDEQAYALATDSDANIIAVGMFNGTIQAGSFMLTSKGSSDIYVIKIAGSTGEVLWAKSFGNTNTDVAYSVALDSSNNIYLTGSFIGTIDFGGGQMLVGAGLTDAIILKLTPTGDYLWSRMIGGGSYDAGLAIAVNGARVSVIGDFRNAMTVNGTTFTSNGYIDVFVATFTTDGAYSWVRSLGGTGFDLGFGIAIDNSGNVVVTGRFENSVDFGGGTLVSAGNADVFLAKYTGSTGAHLLSKRFGSTGADSGNAVTVDSTGNMLLVGLFSASVDFGSGTALTALTNADIVLAKYSPAGACLWAKAYGASGDEVATSITTNLAGDVAITGNFCGTISFGGSLLSAASACPNNDIFAARFSGTNGSHIHSVRAGGAGDEYGQGIAESSDGRFFVSGRFQGFADFGGHALTSAGGDDAFVLGLAPL